MYMSLADSMRSLFWREENCDVIASVTGMFIVYHVTLKEASRWTMIPQSRLREVIQ